jgi:uncharacterized membrane protein YjjB (DUF3815 family)
MKQIEGFGPNGETIMEYSIYDAIRAGFGKVVFIIREEFAEPFKNIFEPKLNGKIETAYVYQSLDKFTNHYPTPTDRTKPWGTAHALLCTKGVVNEPFAVINPVSKVEMGLGVAIGERLIPALGLVPPEALRPVQAGGRSLDVGTAIAIVAIAAGLAIVCHARPRRAPLVLLSCVLGWSAAQLARAAVGAEFAPFFAAMFIGVVGSLYARWRRRPTLAIVLPGLALLLPGCIGFRGVQGLLASDTVGGIGTAVSALTAAAAIAAGLLVANALVPSPRHV